MNKITKFRGEFAFLSNFYYSSFVYAGEQFKTVEHAYQSFKTVDRRQRNRIMHSGNPSRAKRLGNQVVLREDWDKIKLDLMFQLVKAKFEQNSKLKKLLIETGDMDLIEENGYGDTFWGIYHGFGENHLGKILMKIRKLLKNR